MSLESNKIYHRAGVNFNEERGIKLLQEDCKALGEKIGCEVSCFAARGGLNNGNPKFTTSNTSWGFAISSLAHSSDNPIGSVNGVERLQENGEDIIILSSYADLASQGSSNNPTNTTIANIIVFKLDNNIDFILTLAPAGNYNGSQFRGGHIRYDIVQRSNAMYYISGLGYGTNRSLRSRWNLALTSNGGCMSSLASCIGGAATESPLSFKNSEYAINSNSNEASISSCENTGANDTWPCHILSSAYLNIYFTNLVNLNNKEDTFPAIFFVNAKEPETEDGAVKGYSTFNSCCLSSALDSIEIFPKEFFGDALADEKGTIPVLVNMTSKTSDYYTPYLYIKETSSEHLFGIVQLGDKKFIAGSYFCLQCTEGSGS